MIIEACVESCEEALIAQSRGVHRIELCSRLDLDGLTPSPELIRKVCGELTIPVNVMIRPRAGHFICSPEEIEWMKEEILVAKSLGASGIVFGILTPDNQIDVDNCILLTEAASPLPVTFHKAIDQLSDPVTGVRQLKNIPGIARILTSGGKPTAREGAEKIREMILEAGDQLIILVAGKVTRENVMEIRQLTGGKEYHGRNIVGNLRE
jgi:copper homeostasis protein